MSHLQSFFVLFIHSLCVTIFISRYWCNSTNYLCYCMFKCQPSVMVTFKTVPWASSNSSIPKESWHICHILQADTIFTTEKSTLIVCEYSVHGKPLQVSSGETRCIWRYPSRTICQWFIALRFIPQEIFTLVILRCFQECYVLLLEESSEPWFNLLLLKIICSKEICKNCTLVFLTSS